MLDFEYRKANSNSTKGFVLLHGYGANAQDLFPLEGILDANHDYHFFSFQAHQKLEENFLFDSRAWFPIDESRFLEAQQSNRGIDLQNGYNNDVQIAVDKVEETLNGICAKYKLSSLVLGGFSQGAMLAMHVAFNQKFPIEKLVLFSPGFLGKKELEEKIQASKPNFSLFQSHGKLDPILGFEQSQQLHDFFVENAMTAKFVHFDGGHEIPMYVIQEAQSFITV